MSEEAKNDGVRRLIVPVLLLAIGAAVSVALVLLRPESAQRSDVEFEPAVETTALVAFEPPLSVAAHGRVRAAQRITLVAQVSGEVVQVHPNWLEGGEFSAGEALVELDTTRYRAALTRARSNVRATRASLKLAETQLGRVRRLAAQDAAPQSRLDESLSQRKQLEAQIGAQRARARIAREDYEDATIEAPYDGRFVSLDVDAHQVVSAGSTLGTIHRRDILEAVVPLSSRDAALVSEALADDLDVTAEVTGIDGGAMVEARLIGLAAQADHGAQTVDAIVRFDGAPSLRPGQFVDVTLALGLRPDTDDAHRLVELPASALRRGPSVWLVDDETLSIETVEVVHRVGDRVLATIASTADGDLVTSELITVTDDMPVRLDPRGPSA